MKSREVDVAVIGAGSAGLSAYRAAVKQNKRVVLIESGQYGTTCARHACMPSKLLIAAANAAYDTRLLDGFGLRLESPVQVDSLRVLERVRRERDRFAGLVVKEVESYPTDDKLRGHARFLSDTRLTVGEGDAAIEVVTRATVIATGATAVIPDEYRDLGAAIATSDDVFEWQTLPKRIAVIGTGVIALELGQALSRLGVQVTMFGQGANLASISDPDVAAYALQHFRKAFPIHDNVRVVATPAPNGRAQLQFTDAQGEEQVEIFDKVLVATGRRPALEHLSLDNTSVQRDTHGVPVFDGDTLQCGHAPIFIAGDANQQRPWLNDAANEGRIAGEGAAHWPAARPQARPVTLSIVFSDPSILMVGRQWKALDLVNTIAGQVSFEDQGRSRVTQRNQGLLRVYADLVSGKIVGAEGIAPAGEHLAHLIAWSVQQELTINQMLAMPFYHPVFEEGLRTALRDAMHARKKALPPDGDESQPSLSDSVGT